MVENGLEMVVKLPFIRVANFGAQSLLHRNATIILNKQVAILSKPVLIFSLSIIKYVCRYLQIFLFFPKNINMKIQIMGGKITDYLGYKSPLCSVIRIIKKCPKIRHCLKIYHKFPFIHHRSLKSTFV